MLNKDKRFDSLSESLQSVFYFEPKIIFWAFLSISAITLFIYFPAITNSFSIYLTGDQLNTFANTSKSDALENGRWVTDLWLKFLLRQPVPSLSWLVVIICHFLSALMLCYIWGVRSSCLLIVLGVILATNFTLTYMVSWWYLFPTYQLGILFSVSAVYLHFVFKRPFLSIFLSSLCIMLSLASYQPHLSVFVVLLATSVVLQIIQRGELPGRRFWVSEFLPKILSLLLGVMFYFASLKIVTVLLGKIRRIEGKSFGDPEVLLKKILMTVQFFISRVFRYGDASVNFGDWKLYDGLWWYCVYALLFCASFGAGLDFLRNNYKRGCLFTLPVVVGVLLVSYSHVFFISDMSSSQWAARSSGGLLIVILFSVVVVNSISSNRIKKAFAVFALLFVFISGYKGLIYSERVKMGSIELMSRYQVLASQIVSLPNFKLGMTITPVSIGKTPINWDHSISYAYAIKRLIRIPVNVSSRANSKHFESKVEEWGQNMEVWPAGNSVKIVDDNVLVVMGR